MIDSVGLNFSNRYMFGFNGQEKDNEAKGQGNSYDFGARIYDSRLGRWFTVDKMKSFQPAWSTYKSFLDNPIIYADPDGNKEYLTVVIIDNKGNTQVFTKQVSLDIMTDGVVKSVEGHGDTWHFENHYYDFETAIIVEQKEDGAFTVRAETNIFISDKTMRDADNVNFGRGADKYETKADVYAEAVEWINSWTPNEGEGGTQNGGWHLVSTEGAGESKTKYKSSSDVETIEVDLMLAAIGAATKGKDVPKLNSDLGPAEFIDLVKELAEVVKDMPEEPEKQYKCNYPGCGKVIKESEKSQHGGPLEDIE